MSNGEWTEVARGRPHNADSTNWDQAYPHSWGRNTHGNRSNSLKNILEAAEKDKKSSVVVAYNGFGWDVVYAGYMSEVLPKDGQPIASSEGKPLPPYDAVEANGLSSYDWVRTGARGARLLGHTSGPEFPAHIPDMSAGEITRLHQKYIEPGFHHENGRKDTEFTHPSSDAKTVPIEQTVPTEALARLKEAYRNGEPVAIGIDPKTGAWKELQEYQRGPAIESASLSAHDIPKRELNEKPGKSQVASPVQLPRGQRKEPTAQRDEQGAPAKPQGQTGGGVAASPPGQAQIFDSVQLPPAEKAGYPADQQEVYADGASSAGNEGSNTPEPEQENDSKRGLKDILSNLSTGQKAAIAGAAAAVLAIIGAAASARLNPGDAPGRPTGQNPQNRGRF